MDFYKHEELSSRELDELLDWVQDVFGDDEEIQHVEPPSKHQVTNPNRRQLDPPPTLPLADKSGAAAIIISVALEVQRCVVKISYALSAEEEIAAKRVSRFIANL
ncbi:hypothetical protein LWI29_011402 [Acer saccharum]|uniref:Uncharacterized protein n=1 Tax=Acer saccharum TaxID=4024 RepID=A0AA39RPT1_ACESA|nr:hypothetical protein LWI29_011402 [Acer saccharum]